MDKIKSLELEKELKGSIINGFKILRLINNGKSAAVFEAEKDSQLFALKIFDNELIERFGHEIQTKRIEQEIALKNHSIDNLVKIYEGGIAQIESISYYYIVMELINGVNLKEYIKSKDYNQYFVLRVLETLDKVTGQLLTQKDIAHRDIKPENIMVNENEDIILMDLGVLKLVGAKSFSDEEEKSFVGTLRYAAPEFLLRTEEDTRSGWRAINMYQIGATLHDLIMKCELFSDKIPYSNLVIAIKDDMPRISNNLYSFDLQQLTRDMLTKDWKKRLDLTSPAKISKVLSSRSENNNILDKEIDEILKMRIENQSKFDELDKLRRTKSELIQKQKEIGIKLSKELDKCFEILKDKGVFNSMKVSSYFRFDNDKTNTDTIIQNYLYELTGDLRIGFPKNLYVLVRMQNDEFNYTEIEICGIFPSPFLSPSIDNPLNLFKNLAKEKQQFNPASASQSLKTINIFSGIVDFDDTFRNHLCTQIVRLITKALKRVEPVVRDEIKWQEDLVKSNKAINIRTSSGSQTILIDSL
jgi:serine/threonine protein kinase